MEFKLSHLVSLSIFASYFFVILGLFALIVRDLHKLAASSKVSVLKKSAFIGLTIVSFGYTWYYILKFFVWSFSDHGRALPSNSQDLLTQIASWLSDVSLFEQAWSLVCFRPLNWWLSEQLCLFTAGVWTVFVATEGERHQVKHLWVYMLLAQLVAVAVASNLFYLAVLLSQSARPGSIRRPRSLPPQVWLSILISLAAIAASPFTSKKTFLPNLLVMHAVLFVPLIFKKNSTPDKPIPFSIDIRVLYAITCIISAFIHIRTTMTAWSSLNPEDRSSSLHIAKTAWRVLQSNYAQSSIGWDLIWTTVSFIAWMAVRPALGVQRSKFPYLLLATPVASIGITAAYVLQTRDRESDENSEGKKED